jgi:L-alanine-DL-glutamate epimerase-like enolase superfamily enzyme
MNSADVKIEKVVVSAYRIPTDYPESDGTLDWDSTTLVVVEISAARSRGIGYTYANRATAALIDDLFVSLIEGRSAMSVTGNWTAMIRAARNLGRPGIVSMAISAVDAALWDLKARILDVPLVDLFGAVRDSIEVYGSGGFTSYDRARLKRQLCGWVERGIKKVKIKVGREPDHDTDRVAAAREAIGPDVGLFVDANGAYTRKQALAFAEQFSRMGISWFEEPVSSDDLDGLNLLRTRAPAGIDIAAGEYGYDLPYFERMLSRGAVDVLQADASRCGGVSGFLRVSALCEARSVPLSAHCCPALYAHVCCAARAAIHLEYFHDHEGIERMLFEGAVEPRDGMAIPDRARPGLGLEFKKSDARKFAI